MQQVCLIQLNYIGQFIQIEMKVGEQNKIHYLGRQVQLKNVNPPLPVQPSFNEVNQAQQEREQMVNVANGEYNKEVPRARGEAEQKIQASEGYAVKRINEAQGDIARFNAMFFEYQKAPEVTKQRIYIETMKEVLPKLGRKIVIDEDASQILPLLQLSTDAARSSK